MELLLGLHLTACIPSSLISDSQHAYRKGRSTETALHSITSIIEASLNFKEYTLVAFLDIKGAFNNILPTAITGALTDLGVDSRTVSLIDQMLQCRTVEASLGTLTCTRFVSRGTPQGESSRPSYGTWQ
nr:hypothetical protein - fruit fly (Drosophila miranda) transposon TRIM [Drosophila miranda]